MTTVDADPTLLTEGQVLRMVPFASRTLRRRVSAGTFPRPVRLGDDEQRARKLWLRREVVAWVENLAAHREPAAEGSQ